MKIISRTIEEGDVRMCNFFEQFRVSALVGVQPQSSKEDVSELDSGMKGVVLFSVGFFEIGFRCIGRDFQEVVKFAGRRVRKENFIGTRRATYVSCTIAREGSWGG